jgi:hypothetical protein
MEAVLLGVGQKVSVGAFKLGVLLGNGVRVSPGNVGVGAGELKAGPIPFQRIIIKNRRTAKKAIHFNPEFFKTFLNLKADSHSN